MVGNATAWWETRKRESIKDQKTSSRFSILIRLLPLKKGSSDSRLTPLYRYNPTIEINKFQTNTTSNICNMKQIGGVGPSLLKVKYPNNRVLQYYDKKKKKKKCKASSQPTCQINHNLLHKLFQQLPLYFLF